MRVALDATPLVGARSGVGRFVAELAGALGARADVEIGGWIASASFLLGRAGVPDAGGMSIARLPLPAGLARRLWRHLGGPVHERFVGAVDVVHGTNFVVPPTRRAARVVTVHDLSYVHYRDELTAPVAGFDEMVAWAVRGGAAVHVPSRFVAGEVAGRYPGADVTVVAEGAPPLRPGVVAPGTGPPTIVAEGAPPLRPGVAAPGTGPPTIVAVGTAVRRKRFPLLIEAFGLVAAEPGFGDVRLWLAGAPGPDSRSIAAARDRLPPAVRGRVTAAGRVGDAELGRALGGAAVVAVPSVYEGFGLPVLEAMAAGVPVVATNAASLPEVAGDAALLVAPDEPSALAGGLAAVLGDDGLASRLVAAGTARAATFTWDATAAGLVDLYGRLVGRAS